MKKSTIKRRKRVVPANEEGLAGKLTPAEKDNLQAELDLDAPGSSPLKKPRQLSRNRSRTRNFEPPPVDFTDYQIPHAASGVPNYQNSGPKPLQEGTEALSVNIPVFRPINDVESHLATHKSVPAHNQHQDRMPLGAARGGTSPPAAQYIVLPTISSDQTAPSRLSSISSLLNPSIPSPASTNAAPSQYFPGHERRLVHSVSNESSSFRGNMNHISHCGSQTPPYDAISRPPQHHNEVQLPSLIADASSTSTRMFHEHKSPTALPFTLSQGSNQSRRARLRQEANDLREALRRKEKELAELES